MKLYVFDHCPFCVRSLVARGLKDQSIEIAYILEDDVETPTKMIGKQMVPILEYEPQKYMPESLDIVHYIDQLNNKPFLTEKQNPNIAQWLDEYFSNINLFVMPRYAKMDLPELATDAARKAYIDRHEEHFGKFADLQAKEDLSSIEKALQQLAPHIEIKHIKTKKYSLDDVLLFPVLRAVTAIKGISIPDNIRTYTELLSQQTGIELYFNKAC